jgi:hypothetical protein
LRLEIDVPNGISGSVGLPTSSNADSLTDNGLPVRKLEKLGAASTSEDISGARPGLQPRGLVVLSTGAAIAKAATFSGRHDEWQDTMRYISTHCIA